MRPTTFAELLALPEVVEECDLRGHFGFMAYHGGALEESTDLIAREAAAISGASYYGVLQPESLLVHIPSIMVTPDESPTLAAFLDHVEVVVTVHGFGRRPLLTAILLGGRNRALASHVGGHLRLALPEYEVIEELDRIPVELQGVHHRNPVNLPRSGGVQVELPPRARRVEHTAAVIAGLAAAARSFDPGPL